MAREPWRRRACRFLRLALVLALLVIPVLALAALLTVINTARAGAPSQGSSAVETKIEIKVEGKLSQAQRAQIAQLMKSFEGQNPRLKIEAKQPAPKGPKPRRKESERGEKLAKYHFFPFVAATGGGLALATALIFRWPRSRRWLSWLCNLLLATDLALMAFTSLLLVFAIKAKPYGLELKQWHALSGLAFLSLVIFHQVINWRAWTSYFRRGLRWLRSPFTT